MLKEIAALVEEIQEKLIERGGNPNEVSIDIHCDCISSWAILEQAVCTELKEEWPHIDAANRFIVPSILTWNDTPIRLSYGDKL